MRQFNRLFYKVILILVIFSLLGPGASALAAGTSSGLTDQAASHYGGHDGEFITVTLSTGSAPGVGETAALTLSATPQFDAPNLTVVWSIPAGVEWSGPAQESAGAVPAGQTYTSQRQARFPAAGVYRLSVEVSYDEAGGMHVSGPGVLYFTVQAFGSNVSYIDPAAHNSNHSLVPAEVTTQAPAMPYAVNSTPCFTVNGTIVRQDYEAKRNIYNMSYYDKKTVPVTNAPVEIRESDTISDDSYGVAYTDANGHYSLSFCDDDGILDNTLEIYVRLRAELAEGGQDVVMVEDSSYVDEVYEYDTTPVSSGGGTLTFDMSLDWQQSAVFNIAAAVLDAWRFWNLSGGEHNGDAKFAGEAEVHFEYGYGDDGSYYDPVYNEITIADSVDYDWDDDSVIIHEWGHFADDWYGCDDAGSGEHFINQILEDPELSWSEGYSDYWQSAVRAWCGDAYPSWYFDLRPYSSGGISVDLETYASTHADVTSSLNEMSVAGALWDLNDAQNDDQDTVSFTHTAVQRIFTSEEFQSVAYGLFDDTCTFDTYMKAWGLVYPQNAAVAAVVWQNTGYTLPPTGSDLALDPALAPVDVSAPLGGGGGSNPSGLDDSMWWNQVTYVVDNSASMNGSKFNAVKTVLNEAVNDLGNKPNGTQFSLYTYNNTSTTNTGKFAGQYFPANLTSTINNLTTSAAADPLCKTNSLKALNNAIMNQGKGDMWLFTDGDTYTNAPTIENLSQELNSRLMHASIALMGVCPVADPAVDIQPAADQQSSENQAANDQALLGMAQAVLGPAVVNQITGGGQAPAGLVPYLLTAINTGGKFLYVSPANVGSAAEILRAQITHSSGAGTWSDYVSTTPTYLYQKLASWEYNWVDAVATGTQVGTPGSGGISVAINLPNNFRFYNNRAGYSSVTAYQYGYLVFGTPPLINTGINTTLPNAATPNNVLYPFWDSLGPLYVLCDGAANDAATSSGTDQASGCGLNGGVYTKGGVLDDWFVIEYDQYTNGSATYTFEVLLNSTTGEIRYQYLNAAGGAGSATIGLENSTGTSAVQVSYNDVAGASSGMGYKFTPVPPQATRTYTVTVDSTMTSIGFLLTGYSGDFAPLVVKNANNVTVSCATAGVQCYNLGLVQYVQVPVNNIFGTWQATVAPGASGEGTFSFSSMATSSMQARGRGRHNYSTLGGSFVVELGTSIDLGELTGQFRSPDGSLLGGSFKLYDDGAHGDAVPGDGIFGSGNFAPGRGTAYLTVSGKKNNVPFKQTLQTPYDFQPLVVQMQNKILFNQGAGTAVNVNITNYDSVAHCYTINTTLPAGWWLNGLGAGTVCLNAGQSKVLSLTLYLTAGFTNSLAAGTTGGVTVSLVESEQGQISASDSAQVTRTSSPAAIEIVKYVHQLKPNGDTTKFEFWVTDSNGFPVADGTQVNLQVSPGGFFTPASGGTLGGVFKATYTSGSQTGLTTITAQTTNAVSAQTTIDVSVPLASQISINLTTHQMPANNSSTAGVSALVLDKYGSPVANQQVILVVNGDNDGPMFGATQNLTLYTNASGIVNATLTSSKTPGAVLITAELVVNGSVVNSAADTIVIGKRVFLPAVRK